MQQNELVESAFEIEFGKVTKISESNYASTEFEAKRTSRASTKISSSVTHHCRQDIYFTEADTNHEKHISLKDWRVAMKEGDKVAFAFLKGWRRRKIVAVFNYNLSHNFNQFVKHFSGFITINK